MVSGYTIASIIIFDFNKSWSRKGEEWVIIVLGGNFHWIVGKYFLRKIKTSLKFLICSTKQLTNYSLCRLQLWAVVETSRPRLRTLLQINIRKMWKNLKISQTIYMWKIRTYKLHVSLSKYQEKMSFCLIYNPFFIINPFLLIILSHLQTSSVRHACDALSFPGGAPPFSFLSS